MTSSIVSVPAEWLPRSMNLAGDCELPRSGTRRSASLPIQHAAKRSFLTALLLVAGFNLLPSAVALSDKNLAVLPLAVDRPVDFVEEVEPLLAQRCIECHGPARQRAGLRLDDIGAMLKGGDSGPAILLGQSAESLLIQLVAGQDADRVMPPRGEPLTAEEIGRLRAWIDQGADGPRDPEDTTIRPPPHWAFQPVVRPPVPVLPQHATLPPEGSPIDAFVARGLHDSGLSFSPEADRTTLIRRLFAIMLGVPPTPDEVARFLGDARSGAYERLVDRVLADSRYGERWARHWLDVVRFAESNGFETNRERPHAWRYRDYVIDALNRDLPYDRFVREQLAGDALGADAATGFLVGGPVDIVGSPDPVLTAQQRADELDDMVNTTGTAFLGLTLGCARCHTHKFDPIEHREYFAMTAVFAGVRHGDRPLPLPAEDQTRLTALESLNQERERLLAGRPIAYAGTFQQPGPTRRQHRGDPMQQREEVLPGTLAIFQPLNLPADTPEQQRRLALADWIVHPDNPLTARVLVNRLWHYHFGMGLVDTPNDLGRNGSPPTHPELLDWLASELVHQDWSIKSLQRQILLSATWRQSNAPRPEALALDATSRLLWRFPPRRLEAEAIRDGILSVSGALDPSAGGPGFHLLEVERENVYHYHPKDTFGPADFRRMVYSFKVRMEQDDVFGAFDCPDGSLVTPRRNISTTPLQALNLFNSRFVLDQAERFAARLHHESGPDLEAQLQRAWQLAFLRSPAPDEIADALALARDHGVAAVGRALFNANEFLFIP